MQTYSVNTGTETESNSYNLSNDTQFEELLDRLRDNEIGEINPIDIRDSILSLWSNCVFKETSNGDNYYIGIDSSNPDSRDLKYKILLGKNSFQGNSVFNSVMSSSNTDIYFYDTKDDDGVNGETKISLLSGNDSNLFNTAPYLSSQYVSDLNSLTFNIINNNGQISVKSNNNIVKINNINFPTISDSSNIAGIEDNVLLWSNGNLTWDKVLIETGDDFGTNEQDINLQGDVFVNDYLLEFTDDRMSPIDIGGIIKGESFDSSPLSEILKKVVYSYQGPSGSLEILPPYDNGFIEVGTSPTVDIRFTINKKTLPTLITILQNVIPSSYPPITNSGFQEVIGTVSAIISPSPAESGTQSYTIITSDGQESNSDQVNLFTIYPFYSGIGINNSQNYTGMFFLNKLIDGKSDKELQFLGSGKIFFLYPQEYGPLSEINDSNNNGVLSNFDYGIYSFTSPDGNFASKSYYIYESQSTFLFTTPTLYTFKF